MDFTTVGEAHFIISYFSQTILVSAFVWYLMVCLYCPGLCRIVCLCQWFFLLAFFWVDLLSLGFIFLFIVLSFKFNRVAVINVAAIKDMRFTTR